MLFALSRRGDAPHALLEVDSRGGPVKAIRLSVLIGFLWVIFAAVSPDKVLLFLVDSSGAVGLVAVRAARRERPGARPEGARHLIARRGPACGRPRL